MQTKRAKLVLDANAFIGHPEDIKNLRLLYDLTVTPEVIQELKDGAARESFLILKTFLKKKTPSEESKKKVKKFAKRTGDLSRLSEQDIGVIAAALDFIKKRGKEGFLKKRPKKAKSKFGKKKKAKSEAKNELEEAFDKAGDIFSGKAQIEEESQAEEKEEEAKREGEEEAKQEEESEEKKVENTPEKTKKPEEEAYCDGWISESTPANPTWNDYSGGWLGPENIGKLNTKSGGETTDRLGQIGIGVVTSDFAMQNVLLQMGVPLLSLDGTVISKLKSFVLECFSCGALEKDCSKQFCDKCGKNTLSRVTCEYDDEGKLVLYKKKNYKPKSRGVRYNIPDPKGGRRIEDLLLTKDSFSQPKVVSYIRKQKNYKKGQSRKMEIDWDLGFTFETGKQKRKQFHDLEIGYGRKNPNVNGFKKKRNRRK